MYRGLRRWASSLIAVALLLLAACNPEYSGTPTQAEIGLIQGTEAALRSKLKDPNGARFRRVFVSRSGGAIEVCGEVDALNSFGAYSGYQRFIMGEAINLLESDFGSKEMDRNWGTYCSH